MTTASDAPQGHTGLAPETQKGTTVSVDAMGGDLGPSAVIEGCRAALKAAPDLHVMIHGDEAQLQPLIASLIDSDSGLRGRARLQHAAGIVSMTDKPGHVMRHGKDTSMWSTIGAVKDGRAAAAVSCGNTGALMAVSMLQLRRLEGVTRPAIACLWPSRGRHGFNTMLDVGADVKADAPDLLAYAIMGAAYFRNGFSEELPRVGLLNVGTEDHKGRAEIKVAHELMGRMAERGGYSYVGFVEGSDIPSARVDVIVTDGFTGNVALKTGEGTAKFIGELTRGALTSSLLAKLGALLSMGALKRLSKRIDPRRNNGGVFLGLNGTVVKSHGSSDATAFAAAIALAHKLALSGYQTRLSERLVFAALAAQDEGSKGEPA